MFSATGRILPGSEGNPEIKVYADFTHLRPRPYCQEPSLLPSCKAEVHFWNTLGYGPIVSTVTGLARALIATVHTIVHLANAFFSSPDQQEHLEEAGLGMKNIARGLIESVPILGNIAMFILDETRKDAWKQDVLVELSQNREGRYRDAFNRMNEILLFSDVRGQVTLSEHRPSAGARLAPLVMVPGDEI